MYPSLRLTVNYLRMCELCSPNWQTYQLPHRQSHMITAAAELVAGRWGAEHCWGSGARTLRTLSDRCYAHGNSAPRSTAVSGPRRLTTAWPGGRLWRGREQAKSMSIKWFHASATLPTCIRPGIQPVTTLSLLVVIINQRLGA